MRPSPYFRTREASLVPVIYLATSQCVTLKTPPPQCGRIAAESCNPTRQTSVRLLTLVNGDLSGKPIALGPFEC